jgi:endogenous inhibitor of DNA gyrase (YacG/DUF329 family)
MTTAKTTGVKQVNCPSCQKIVPWSEESPFRPFCSKQCQLIDFGDWANERNAIPVEDGPEDFRLDELDVSDPENPEGF